MALTAGSSAGRIRRYLWRYLWRYLFRDLDLPNWKQFESVSTYFANRVFSDPKNGTKWVKRIMEIVAPPGLVRGLVRPLWHPQFTMCVADGHKWVFRSKLIGNEIRNKIVGITKKPGIAFHLLRPGPALSLGERVPGLGQITWWTCWEKNWGAIWGKNLHGNREIVVEWTVGVWVHRDSWLGAQMGSVLPPNTNAQRMSFLSHLLRSAWGTFGQDCWSFPRSL